MSDTPIFSKRQLVQSLGQFAAVFLTGIAAKGAMSSLTWDDAAASGIAAALSVLAILGFSYVPPRN